MSAGQRRDLCRFSFPASILRAPSARRRLLFLLDHRADSAGGADHAGHGPDLFGTRLGPLRGPRFVTFGTPLGPGLDPVSSRLLAHHPWSETPQPQRHNTVTSARPTGAPPPAGNIFLSAPMGKLGHPGNPGNPRRSAPVSASLSLRVPESSSPSSSPRFPLRPGDRDRRCRWHDIDQDAIGLHSQQHRRAIPQRLGLSGIRRGDHQPSAADQTPWHPAHTSA